MKHFEEGTQTRVIREIRKKVAYVECDCCGKKIMPPARGYKTDESKYVRIHTWHSDWGNDSVDSHEYNDCCTDCAISFVSEYIKNLSGTKELELENCEVWSGEYETFSEVEVEK